MSSPVLSIILNGSTSQTVNLSRGLQQGDPLSPFIFIIATKGLVCYLKTEARNAHIKGLRLRGNHLPIAHQQFVDEIMLFCQVSLREACRIEEVLLVFMEASGTMINNEKS